MTEVIMKGKDPLPKPEPIQGSEIRMQNEKKKYNFNDWSQLDPVPRVLCQASGQKQHPGGFRQ